MFGVRKRGPRKGDQNDELHWLLGYPFALALMLLGSVSLYVIFKRRGWL